MGFHTFYLYIYPFFLHDKRFQILIEWFCRGEGLWTREGCETSGPEPGFGDYVNDTFINCTCNHLSSFAVILNDAEAEVIECCCIRTIYTMYIFIIRYVVHHIMKIYILQIYRCCLSLFYHFFILDHKQFLAEPSIAEDVTTYTGLVLTLVLLMMAFIAFCLLRGAQTNSNTIHKNLTACLFLVQLLFLAALKIRHFLVQQEVKKVLLNGEVIFGFYIHKYCSFNFYSFID